MYLLRQFGFYFWTEKRLRVESFGDHTFDRGNTGPFFRNGDVGIHLQENPDFDATIIRGVRLVAPAVFAITVALSLLVVDTRADASFDAPKRLVVMIGIAIAMTALAFTPNIEKHEWTRRRRAIAICLTIAFACVAASSFFSPHRAIAVDALRTMLVFAAVPLIVTSQERAWRWTTNAFLIGAGVNAIVSIVQFLSIAQPFQYVTKGGRGQVSAMIGNTGILGLICAFAILLIVPRLTRTTIGLWALLVLLIATLAINRSITPIVVVAAGSLVYLPRFRTRAFAAGAVLFFTFGAMDTAHQIDKALSYRFGPWRAALAMTAERPLLGFGAGTYGAEYARHTDLKFVNIKLLGSYAQAHNDYLQALAELGIPATLSLLAAFVMLMRGPRTDLAAFSILIGGAIAALTWFPMQRPETALLLLAASGRMWRDA